MSENTIKDFEFFVRLDHIRKCFTQKGGIFVLEEYNPKTRNLIQRKYQSSMAAEIVLSFHRVTSVQFAYICHLNAASQRGTVGAKKQATVRGTTEVEQRLQVQPPGSA